MSIKIENIQTMGWEGALRGMRNPLNSWDKADSAYASDIERTDTNIAAYGTKLNRYDFVIGQNDLALCLKLIKAGSEHRKFLRMIHVQMDITAPLYWWKEFDTYKVATTSNSCSTMHKIAAKPFETDDFSHDHLLRAFTVDLNRLIGVLNVARDEFLERNDKAFWWQMIQLLPTSYNQRRTIDMSMETVLNILSQRHSHKLDEWVEFCDTMLSKLPYAEDFYLAEGGVCPDNNDHEQKGEPDGN